MIQEICGTVVHFPSRVIIIHQERLGPSKCEAMTQMSCSGCALCCLMTVVLALQLNGLEQLVYPIEVLFICLFVINE